MRFRVRLKNVGFIWRAGLVLMVLALIERAVLIPDRTSSTRWVEASSGFLIGLALVCLIQGLRGKKRDAGTSGQTPAA